MATVGNIVHARDVAVRMVRVEMAVVVTGVVVWASVVNVVVSVYVGVLVLWVNVLEGVTCECLYM